jgi:hypothetical protein
LYSATRNAWVAAGDLKAGEALTTRDGAILVREIVREGHGPTPVYNLEVADGHKYYAGSRAVLAHNQYAGGGGPKAATAYKRPSGATTPAQRASVQGKPCVDCSAVTPKQFADHKVPLVKEYYESGSIDKTRMRSVDAVQPQCPTCSNRQGADMSRYSRAQRQLLKED